MDYLRIFNPLETGRFHFLIGSGVKGMKTSGGNMIGGKLTGGETKAFEAARAEGDRKKMEAIIQKAHDRRLAEKAKGTAPTAKAEPKKAVAKAVAGTGSPGSGNPKFKNQTSLLDTDSITSVSPGKMKKADIEKMAQQMATKAVGGMPQTALIDLDSVAKVTGRPSWSAEKIEKVAQSIVANNGTILNIPVAKRNGDGYTLVAGANEFAAYQRARKINPALPDRIRILEGDAKDMQPFRKPPLVKSTGVDQFQVIGNSDTYRAYQRAMEINPNLPDRFRFYTLGKGETVDSLMPQFY